MFRAGEEVYPACPTGGQGVAGSNPVHPTRTSEVRTDVLTFFGLMISYVSVQKCAKLNIIQGLICLLDMLCVAY